jgi:Ca2+-binding RTX toxin-like protein
MVGGEGLDTIVGSEGDDRLFGESGNDQLFGGVGNDWLDGGAGNDTLFGGDGLDTIIGGAGVDTYNGGAGNDFFDIGRASDAQSDIIQDFRQGDKIDISDMNLAQAKTTLAVASNGQTHSVAIMQGKKVVASFTVVGDTPDKDDFIF